MNDLKMKLKGKTIKYLWAEKSEISIAVIAVAICRVTSISEDPKPWDCTLNYIKRIKDRETWEGFIPSKENRKQTLKVEFTI